MLIPYLPQRAGIDQIDILPRQFRKRLLRAVGGVFLKQLPVVLALHRH
jgi:hypothetical protein